MAFWCTKTLRERVEDEKLIIPFNRERVKHSAYEMGVGPEAFVTSESDKKKVNTVVPPGEKIVIPPGQFGLLTTQETITVPVDAIAFISIRAGIKFRGLVNVSGFHVDPGYNGHLTFGVYNAGSQDVVLDREQPVFMIWFSELDDVDDEPYKNKSRGQHIISSEAVTRIQGEVASPAELKKRIDALEHKLSNLSWLFSIIISGVLVKVFLDTYQNTRKEPAAVPVVQAPARQLLSESPPAVLPETQPGPVLTPAVTKQTPTPTLVPPLPDAQAKKGEPKLEDEQKKENPGERAKPKS